MPNPKKRKRDDGTEEEARIDMENEAASWTWYGANLFCQHRFIF
jgi:hypothetical protein